MCKTSIDEVNGTACAFAVLLVGAPAASVKDSNIQNHFPPVFHFPSPCLGTLNLMPISPLLFKQPTNFLKRWREHRIGADMVAAIPFTVNIMSTRSRAT
jgi:hypothetical protein